MKRLIPLIGLLLSACTSAPQTSSGKVRIATSFYPLTYVAQQIGGEYVDVIQVTPAGVEPHDFEPSAQQVADIYESDILFINGQGLDPWAERLQADLEANGVRVVQATDAVELRPLQEEHEEDHEPAFDPHVWLDPNNMIQIGEALRIALSAADAKNAAFYAHADVEFGGKMSTLAGDYGASLAQCGVKEIIVSHNAFSYLAERYQFIVHSIAGISPDEDPSPKRIAELATLAKQKNIQIIFFEALANPRISETIAAEAGVATAVLNPIEGRTDEEIAQGKEYDALMRDNLLALRAAMRCQ